MDWLVATILGIVQGLTEFLPVSSSAHLRIVGELLMPGREPGAFFTAIIQVGTELAVLVYFWNDIVTIITKSVSYTHLTLPTILRSCRSRWSPYH